MNRFQAKGALERGAAVDLWRRTLSQIPTRFGRLVYLCSLRDPNTGRYEHHGLAQYFSPEEADRALRESHEQTFRDWLCLNLEQQKADLEEYLSGLSAAPGQVLGAWMRLSPYRSLAPSSARDMERDLYLADLEAILALLANQYGIQPSDPDA